MILGTNQEKWLAALESGEYKQTKGHLCKDGAYCCLGVACDVLGATRTEQGPNICDLFDGSCGFLPETIRTKLGMIDTVGVIDVDGEEVSLISMNDNGKSFTEIAQFIRDNSDKLFSEPM